MAGETKKDSDKKEGEEETPAAVDEQAMHDVVAEVVNAASAASATTATTPTPKKKRLCRYPGCTKVIKSQGHCQRHGARAKRCKVEGCEKQAQGTHEGMCKRHWKAVHFPPAPPKPEQLPPPPEGESVYDTILPASVSYRPANTSAVIAKAEPKEDEDEKQEDASDDNNKVALVASPDTPMPLVSFLKDGAEKPAGWHREAERRARGVFPVSSLSSQLEPWERQLALMEILLLSGGTPQANLATLAHAWGREKGFHHLLVQSVCERRGEVERKKRSDAGRTMTEEEKEAFRAKLKKAKTNKDEEEGKEEEGTTTTSEPMDTTAAEEELKPASVEEMVEKAAESVSVSV